MVELRWRDGLTDAEIAEVLALVAAATRSDETAPLSEQVLLHVRGGDAGTAHLLAVADDRIVGYAHLDVTGRAAGAVGELVVLPDRRRAGVGAALVRALLDRAEATDPPVPLQLWANGALPGAVALARGFGFTQTRELWRMRRSLLTPIGEPRLPDGVRLRPFVVGADEPEFLRVNNAAFDWHPDQGGWSLDQVELREAEPWFDPEGFLLAVNEADRLLGFHWTKVHGEDSGHSPDPIGEVYVLGVDPEARGMHLGAALTLAGLRHLRDHGLHQVMLYVEADNAPAVSVYRRLGFTRSGTDVAFVR